MNRLRPSGQTSARSTTSKEKIMTRRKRSTTAPTNPSRHARPVLPWTITTDWTHNGRHVTPGVEVKIEGERGRFRFQRHVRNDATGKEWVDVISDTGGFRAFRPERVKTIHRTQKTRANASPNVRRAA